MRRPPTHTPMSLRSFTPLRWVSVLLAVSLGVVACGDDAVEYDDGTVTGLISGPGNGLTWAPAESLEGDTELELVAALESMGEAMIVPTVPPPNGDTTSADFSSYSMGYMSGRTFAGTASVTLYVTGSTGFLVNVFRTRQDCREGSVTLTIRGDTEACAHEGEGEALWEEDGRQFTAVFGESLTLEQGLVWLETWRLIP